MDRSQVTCIQRNFPKRLSNQIRKCFRISNLFYTVQMTCVILVFVYLINTSVQKSFYFVMSYQNRSSDNETNNASVVYVPDARLNLSHINDSSSICAETFLLAYEDFCSKTMAVNVNYRPNSGSLQVCPCRSTKLLGNTGPVALQDESFIKLESTFREVQVGGHWSPSSECIARQRIAIIIPFRDRESHLRIFLGRMHPLLQRQLLEYTIVVVEQANQDVIFNKGVLMNAGFKEIQKSGQFDCFIFHDVDLLPENDRNFYTCANFPRHVGAYLDKFGYNVGYYRIFGGGTAFTKRQFELANGFSNQFFGWGGEDDDMLNRVEAAKMTFIRYPKCVATYTVIKHPRDKGNPYNPKSSVVWNPFPPLHYQKEGLAQAEEAYTLNSIEKRPLYTLMNVSVKSLKSQL